MKVFTNRTAKTKVVLNGKQLRGAVGEIWNFYNFSARMLIFGTHIPPIITIHAAKFRSYL